MQLPNLGRQTIDPVVLVRIQPDTLFNYLPESVLECWFFRHWRNQKRRFRYTFDGFHGHVTVARVVVCQSHGSEIVCRQWFSNGSLTTNNLNKSSKERKNRSSFDNVRSVKTMTIRSRESGSFRISYLKGSMTIHYLWIDLLPGILT